MVPIKSQLSGLLEKKKNLLQCGYWSRYSNVVGGKLAKKAAWHSLPSQTRPLSQISCLQHWYHIPKVNYLRTLLGEYKFHNALASQCTLQVGIVNLRKRLFPEINVKLTNAQQHIFVKKNSSGYIVAPETLGICCSFSIIFCGFYDTNRIIHNWNHHN